MNDLLDKVSGFLQSSPIVGRMVFGSTGDTDDQISTHTVDLDIDVTEYFRTSFLKEIGRYHDVSSQEYLSSDHDPEAFFIQKLSEMPEMSSVIGGKPSELSSFDQEFIESIKFTSLHFENAKLEILRTFKYYPRTRFLSKDKSHTIFFSDKKLKLLKMDALVADPSIDFLTFGEHIMIFSQNSFEKVLNFRKLHEENMGVVFRHFRSGATDYTIARLDEMESECKKDIRRLRRLSSIRKKSLFSSLDFETLAQFISQARVDAVVDTKNKTVRFNKVSAFLHFYDDNHLLSELTKLRYLAPDKTAY